MMENTLKNISHFTSSKDPQVKSSPSYQPNQGDYVFWRVNIKELFDVDINYPGIKGALNQAFEAAKAYVPVDSGITKRSMTQKIINDYTIEVFFDPDKIIGKIRFGRKVTENYTIYIAESPKRFNWIAICMYHYYKTLYAAMRTLKKNATKKTEENKGIIDFTTFSLFYESLKSEYQEKKEEAIELRKQQREKKKAKEEAIKEKKRKLRLKNDKVEEVE